MADHQTSFLTPTKNPISSFLGSPRFFNGLLTNKIISENQESNLMSPTSILDTKNSNSSIFVNPFGYDRNLSNKSPIPSHSINKSEPEAIGLALIDSLNDEEIYPNFSNFSKPVNRMALFGSKLKAVQIPLINPSSLAESPESPPDFGIKTRDSQFSGSPSGSKDHFMRQLSLKEMELSEDYTCVIIHGPNPKTTHIFDDCIVEDVEISDQKKIEFDSDSNFSDSASVDFLSFCHTCKDNLGQEKDTLVHRGQRAFPSDECRCQEILFDGTKDEELDDAF